MAIDKVHYRSVLIGLLLAAALQLPACGQYGDLYLPEKPQTQAPPADKGTSTGAPMGAPSDSPLDSSSEPLVEP